MTVHTPTLEINGHELALDALVDTVAAHGEATLSSGARERIAAARAVVDGSGDDTLVTYGLNTGVGRFFDQRIEPEFTGELQRRILRSHAAGVGDPYPDEIIRGAMLLRANVLALGYSGVRENVVELLLAIYNAGLVPHVPSQGSVGASGDLAPLAHMCLPLIGEGHVQLDGELLDAADGLARCGLAPLELAAKEGLSLINGTQFMTSMGAYVLVAAERLARIADVACALSVEALRGSRNSFLAGIHAVRPHPGQIASAANMYDALADSAIVQSHELCDRVQDAYALRCAPQVHGASRDALSHARRVLEIEASSATDNPLVFAEALGGVAAGSMQSGGNFHGQPIAIVLDLMAIALAELANISERRIERLVNPSLSGLPAFLTPNGGLNSGFMIGQYTAAALVSENKVLCHPASVDSVPTSAGQEDHVSMGNHAGLKLLRVLANVRRVLSIELLCAAQAVEFLHPRTPGRGAAALHAAVRARVKPMHEDRVLSTDIERIADDICGAAFMAELQREAGFTLR